MGRIVQVARFTADGSQVTREFKSMGDAGAQMSQRLQQGARAIPPAMRAVDASAGVARQKIDQLASSAGSAGTVLRALGPAGIAAAAALGGLGVVFAALSSQARNAVRELGALYDTARRLDISTRTLQEWRFAMIGIGADASAAEASLGALNRALGQLNTEVGQRALSALRELGFTEDEIRNMGTVEQALPRIADRIRDLGNASAQAAIAQKLGLEPMLPLLQRGSAAFNEAAQAAQRMGYVLDEELLQRASQFNGEWAQAAAVIDVQLKSALVDIAPYFIDLAREIAGATRALVEFLDRFKDIETMSARGLRRRQTEALAAQSMLLRERGAGALAGGDPSRGADLLRGPGGAAEVLGVPVGFVGRQGASNALGARIIDPRDARDIYAALSVEVARAQERLDAMGTPNAPNSRDRPTRADPAGVDRVIEQQRQFVAQLQAEAQARADLARIMAGNRTLTREEAESIRALETDLRTLSDARRSGVIASDAELRLLTQLRVARDDEAEAARKQALAQDRARAAHDRRLAFDRQLETPQQRIAREIAELQRDPDYRPDQIAEGVRRLQQEYRELAAAQYEASVEGRVLAGVMQGQIRSVEDLQRVLASMLADAALRELMAGGVGGEGGAGGFIGRVFGRMGAGSGLSGLLSGGIVERPREEASVASVFGDFSGALGQSAREIADAFTPSVAEAGVKLGATATAATAGALAQRRSITALEAFSAALRRATAAAAGEGEPGGKAASLVKALLLGGPTAGGGGAAFGASLVKALVRGGPKAGGGGLALGAHHSLAENGPELALLGGWGQVFPNEAVRGLALLGQAARQPAAAAAAATPAVNVSLTNESGVALDARAIARRDADGALAVEVALTRKVSTDLARGQHNDALAAQFGLTPQRIVRG